MPCSYDMEVASATYFRALDAGAAPIVLLFNGSVFYDIGGAMSVEPIAWDCEANAALPVATLARADGSLLSGQRLAAPPA